MRRSFSSNDSKPRGPGINKDPFYRTHDIFNGVYERRLALQPADISNTDCQTYVGVNFNKTVFCGIVGQPIDYDAEGRSIYILSCGNEFRAAKGSTHPMGKKVGCKACSEKEAYLSFEHEWGHNVCKSSPYLWNAFIDAYIQQLENEGYIMADVLGFSQFLHHVINAFDDIRTNSVWSYIYPGSALMMWNRWRRICEEEKSNEEMNEQFPVLIFGVALHARNVNYKDGPLSDLIPILQEATTKVLGKGTANMLIIVRWTLDQCVKRFLQPSPPPMMMKGMGQQSGKNKDDDQQDDSSCSQQAGSGAGDAGSSDPDEEDGDEDQGAGGGIGDPAGNSGDAGTTQDSGGAAIGGPTNAPSKHAKTDALKKLTAADGKADIGKSPTPSKRGDPASTTTQAIINKALGTNIDTSDPPVQSDSVDPDMQKAIDQFKNSAHGKGPDKYILANAKAKLMLVDVKPGDITGDVIELGEKEKQAVQRMRAAFARVMGRVRAKMDVTGSNVDVQSVIQFLVDPSNEEIFHNEAITKGFAYMTLCDMSGSMYGSPFHQVCTASEILKKALDYPFVENYLWGFRTGQGAEINLFRYDQNCRGYTGYTRASGANGKMQHVHVECDGLTPINSSIHVATKFMHSQVAAGMAKRIFLLTDGDPTHVTTRLQVMSAGMLRKFTANEIRAARKVGIQVYTFIIGNAISENSAKEMFGPPRYWRRIRSQQDIRKSLVDLVINEFVKYIRS